MHIKRIAHVGDVHIRKTKRHKEYRLVFEKLYKSLKEQRVDVIYVAGDIVHNKTDLSPEAVKLMGDFFVQLSKIAPTYCIIGNHDCIVSQKGRLDAISPVVDLQDIPNFTLYRKSGLFDIGNVVFGVFDINDTNNWPSNPKKENGKTYIGLYHGAINNSFTNQSFRLSTDHDITMFDGYDYALLGDIHSRQFLNDEKTVAYPGTLIQQNFGEDVEKGYMIWDLEESTSNFIEIENDYGFRTYRVKDKDISRLEDIDWFDMPKYPNVRVFISSKSYNVSNKTYIENVLRRKYNPQNIYVKPYDNIDYKDFDVSGIELSDVTKLSTQVDLLKEYFSTAQFSEKYMEELLEAHKVYYSNSEFSNNENSRAKRWIIKNVKFSNMFSYGEDNEINFDNLHGITGIFSDNASGKSNLLYTILNGLFNSSTRASRNSIVDVINDNKDIAHVQIELDVDGQEYIVDRTIKRSSKDENRAKNTIKLYKVVNGEHQDIMGKNNTNATEKYIRDMLGSYDEHSMTTFSQQFDVTNFIDFNQSSRKELLSKFLGLDVIESIYRSIKDENTVLKRAMKSYENEDTELLHREALSDKENIESFLEECKEKRLVLEDKISQKRKRMLEVQKKVKNIESGFDLDLEELQDELDFCESEIKSINEDIERTNKDIEDATKRIEDSSSKKQELESLEDVEKKLEEYNSLVSNGLTYEREVDSLEKEIKTRKRSVEILGMHDWFETENACSKCSFLQDAFAAKGQLVQLEDDMNKKMVPYTEITNGLKNYDYENLLETKDKHEEYEIVIKNCESYLSNVEHHLENYEDKIQLFEEKKLTLQEKVQNFHNNEEDIKKNSLYQKEMDMLDSELVSITNEVSELDEESLRSNVLYGKVIERVSNLKERLSEISEVIRRYDINQKLVSAFSADGIPFMIISKVLPVINNKIKDILNDVENFDVSIEIDKDTKDLQIYIDDGVMRKRVEKGSGMEKTISALTIRAALANVSLIPHCNLFVIDEGFGTLDSTNLNNINHLLLHMKNHFANVMIISHIESMKDVTDNIINIYKDDTGYSHITIK
jgi:DNA repair exonuclease SbcCD ATPase subunit/predicted phosphodiesterase